MRLREGARIAIIGAGPSGLAAAKHGLDSGFDVTVFEADRTLGGQWHTSAAHSGVWPGMRTNTSRAMTAFSDLGLYHRTLHPDLPGLGVIGQFLAQGPYFPLLELQARWIAAAWSGAVTLAGDAAMRAAIAQPRPAIDAHNALALTLAEALGVAPEPAAWPELCEALVFGPLLPPRYRLSGPGARPDAAALFAHQHAASPRAPVDPADVDALARLGLEEEAGMIAGSAAAVG